MHANEAYVIESLRSGAAGYVLKDSSSADLVRAIAEAATAEEAQRLCSEAARAIEQRS